MNIEEICDDFEDLGDAEDQMQYLIELGQGLNGLDARHKTEANRVQGCQSNVWLIARPDEQSPSGAHPRSQPSTRVTSIRYRVPRMASTVPQ